MSPRAAEQFARVVVEMVPYAHEIVFVGGWVHALYLAEANETGAVRTDDVDITIPPVLLTVQGYPGQRMLLESTREMRVGTAIHALLDPARTIRVPTIGAYVIQKGMASSSRANPLKAAKDLVYLYEIVRHPNLGKAAFAETPTLRGRYPTEHGRWKAALEDAVATPSTLRHVSAALIASGRTFSAEADVTRSVMAYFRRLIAEG